MFNWKSPEDQPAKVAFIFLLLFSENVEITSKYFRDKSDTTELNMIKFERPRPDLMGE